MQKTILITGATDGIGLLTAQKLFSEGQQVLLHGRNEAKLTEAAKQLGGAPAYLADLSSGSAVEALADAVCENTIKEATGRLSARHFLSNLSVTIVTPTYSKFFEKSCTCMSIC